jgi:hypothetical protein
MLKLTKNCLNPTEMLKLTIEVDINILGFYKKTRGRYNSFG